MTIKYTSFESIQNDIIESLKIDLKECPDSQNKTFEELCDWSAKHILLTPKDK